MGDKPVEDPLIYGVFNVALTVVTTWVNAASVAAWMLPLVMPYAPIFEVPVYHCVGWFHCAKTLVELCAYANPVVGALGVLGDHTNASESVPANES